jgi:hypothetical protein
MTLASAIWSWKDKEVSLSCWLVELLLEGKGGGGALTYLEFWCSVKRTEREINSLLLNICSTHRFENLITSFGIPLQSIFAPYLFSKRKCSLTALPKKECT